MEQKLLSPTSDDGDIVPAGSALLQHFNADVSPATGEEERDTPSVSALSLSDSSDESPLEFATLLGEEIETNDTTTNFGGEAFISLHAGRLEDPPLPSMLPTYRPSTFDKDTNPIWEITDVCKTLPLLPPPQYKESKDPHAIMEKDEPPQYKETNDLGANVKLDEDCESAPLTTPQSKDDLDTVPSTSSNGSGALSDHCVGRMIGHYDLMDMVSYPCCQQILHDPVSTAKSTHSESHPVLRKRERMTENSRGISLLAESTDEDDIQLEEDMRTGVLGEGVRYRISRVLVEGLLHKKGSGYDLLRSRSWKARWARLALGHVEGYGHVAVPLLCIAWYPSSTVSSTVIVLDSTVVLSVDAVNKENPYRFEIRHASSRENSSLPYTRTFSAPTNKARDAWVYAMSQALLTYEKEIAKARTRRAQNNVNKRQLPSPFRQGFEDRSTSPSRSLDELWTGDRFFTTVNGPMRPTSPISTPLLLRDALASPPRPIRSPSMIGTAKIRRRPKFERSTSA